MVVVRPGQDLYAEYDIACPKFIHKLAVDDPTYTPSKYTCKSQIKGRGNDAVMC